MRFGLLEGHPMTLDEVGHYFRLLAGASSPAGASGPGPLAEAAEMKAMAEYLSPNDMC